MHALAVSVRAVSRLPHIVGPACCLLPLLLMHPTFLISHYWAQGIPLETPLQALSGGLQRRASLAVALARKPRLLLLDEPLSGLDWRACSDIAAVLREPLLQRHPKLLLPHVLQAREGAIKPWSRDPTAPCAVLGMARLA